MTCYLPDGQFLIDQVPKATVNDLLEALEAQLSVSCDGYQVYRVPPPCPFQAKKHSESQRDQVRIAVKLQQKCVFKCSHSTEDMRSCNAMIFGIYIYIIV